MTSITGNTFPVKEQIKALGGRWDRDAKVWIVPDDKADAVRALVSGTSRQNTAGRPNAFRRSVRTGCRCGSIVGVSRQSDCFTCRIDA